MFKKPTNDVEALALALALAITADTDAQAAEAAEKGESIAAGMTAAEIEDAKAAAVVMADGIYATIR